MSRPIDAKTLLQLDKRLEVEMLQCYPIPEQVVWQAGKNDYSEVPIHKVPAPLPSKCGEWIVESLLANERGHYGCYSSDTEVLTEDGWVLWPEVTTETVLAAYDINTGLVTFETPSAVQRWDYNGKMYHLEGQALDFLVSPDHRMIVQNTSAEGDLSERYVISAADVFKKSVTYSTVGYLSDNQRKTIHTPINSPIFWNLLGIWLVDGIISKDPDSLCFLVTNETLTKLRIVCGQLNIEVFDTGPSSGGVEFYLSDKKAKVYAHYPGIGEWFNANCTTKKQVWTKTHIHNVTQVILPTGYLRLNHDCLHNLFKGIGTLSSQNLSITNGYFSQLQALAAINGIGISSTMINGSYHLKLTDNLSPQVNSLYKEEWVDYTGEIHCATVSTGALIVRRNNKVAVCGNCLEHPQITFSCAGFVHNVVVQGRTHRIGTSWDVQSQRYTGRRVLKVASGELDAEEVFYVRPAGFYVNRKGKKYDWTEDDRAAELQCIIESCKLYSLKYNMGMCEEHIRDYLPQAIRQNFVVSFNLRSVLHFMDLRSKLDAQLEIQALCESFIPELKRWAPNVWQYYEEKRLHKARLSP
jgi:thymidylate synthase (FAD)